MHKVLIENAGILLPKETLEKCCPLKESTLEQAGSRAHSTWEQIQAPLWSGGNRFSKGLFQHATGVSHH
jgi:hypothetical protein